MWDFLFGPLFPGTQSNFEDQSMCNHNGTRPTPTKEDPDAIKANQVWYIEGVPYVVLQPLAKYLRQCDGEETPYVVIREQGKESVALLTHRKFREVATRTAPDVKRYITFEKIMGGNPCWQGAIRMAYIMGVIPSLRAASERGTEDWYWLGRQAAMSSGRSQVTHSCQDLYVAYERHIGKKPGHSYLVFAARVLGLIPEGASPDLNTVKRLLGIK